MSGLGLWYFNTTFNNISVISGRGINEINFDNKNQIKSLVNLQMGIQCTNLLHSVSTVINKY
jgi:hypothetical protein